MSNATQIWEQIKQNVIKEGLVDTDEVKKINIRVEAGSVSSEDWLLAIENTLLKEERDA